MIFLVISDKNNSYLKYCIKIFYWAYDLSFFGILSLKRAARVNAKGLLGKLTSRFIEASNYQLMSSFARLIL